MHHEFALIATLAWGLGLALVLGFAATKVKLPALVGYLLAGVCIAPTTPGFVGDMDLAAELSEVGVMLLMFGVGLHFSLTDLLRVKTVALPGAIIQMAIATAIGMGMAHWWGWSWGEAFILGFMRFNGCFDEGLGSQRVVAAIKRSIGCRLACC